MNTKNIPLPDIDFSGIVTSEDTSTIKELYTDSIPASRKLLFFDVETTGLEPGFNEICQIALILDIDGHTVWEYETIVRPEFPCRVHPTAIETHGITINRMRYEGISQHDLHFTICNHLSRYIDKYNPNDKAAPCAYNGPFDYAFLSALWKRCNDKFLGSFLNHRIIDPLAYFRFLASKYEWKLANMKLSTVAEHFGISLSAHDALSDTRALRKIFYNIYQDI